MCIKIVLENTSRNNSPEGVARVSCLDTSFTQWDPIGVAQPMVLTGRSSSQGDHGAEAIVLGGTDLFLAFAGHDPGFPVIDCADIHVDAIYARSTGG